MIAHRSPISGIAAYEGIYVATAGYDNQVILWDAKTKTALNRGYHDHLANQCQFSPCGQWLASSGSDYTARLWRLPDMQLLTVFGDHTDDVEGIAFHPNKPLLATVSRDSTIRLFDLFGKLLLRFKGHNNDVLSIVWVNDDEFITSSDDGTIKRWSVSKHALLESKDLGGVETDTIAIHPNGTIFAGNDEGEIIVINRQHCLTIKAHKAGIKRLCYSLQANKLVSLSYDRSFCIWSVNNKGTLTQITQQRYPDIVWARSCDFLDETTLVFVSFGSSYASYDYQTNHWNLNQVNETNGINAVTVMENNVYAIGDSGIVWKNRHQLQKLPSLCNFLSSLGDILITGGQTGTVFNALTGDTIYQHHSPLNCCATYRKGGYEYAIIGSYTGEGIILKYANSTVQYLQQVKLHNNAIKGISTSNEQIFSVCADYAAAFHPLDDLSCVKLILNAHSKIANGCVHLLNNRFASVSRDLKCRFFSKTAIEIIDTPHTHSIKSIACSSDGNIVATGGYNGEIHLYNVSTRQWGSQRPTASGISSLYYDVKQQRFLASSYDGNVYVVDT